MTIEPLALFFGGLILFLLGYESAVHVWRHRRKVIERVVEDLETKMLTLQDQLDEDPTRAGIDHGKLYIINQLESFTRHLREELR